MGIRGDHKCSAEKATPKTLTPVNCSNPTPLVIHLRYRSSGTLNIELLLHNSCSAPTTPPKDKHNSFTQHRRLGVKRGNLARQRQARSHYEMGGFVVVWGFRMVSNWWAGMVSPATSIYLSCQHILGEMDLHIYSANALLIRNIKCKCKNK